MRLDKEIAEGLDEWEKDREPPPDDEWPDDDELDIYEEVDLPLPNGARLQSNDRGRWVGYAYQNGSLGLPGALKLPRTGAVMAALMLNPKVSEEVKEAVREELRESQDKNALGGALMGSLHGSPASRRAAQLVLWDQWHKEEDVSEVGLGYKTPGRDAVGLGAYEPGVSAVRQILLTQAQNTSGLLKLLTRPIVDYGTTALLADQPEVDGAMLGLALEQVLERAASPVNRLHPADALQAIIVLAQRANREKWEGLLLQCLKSWQDFNKDTDHANLEQACQMAGCTLRLMAQEEVPGVIEALMEQDSDQRFWDPNDLVGLYVSWGPKALAPLLKSHNKNLRILAANIAAKIAPPAKNLGR